MNIKKHIPNTITCGNLLCGCLAIVKAFQGDLVWAAYLVGIAAVLDFFDGFAARMLKVSSPIGKDLDSLADMVTFGVVPGVVMFHMILFSVNTQEEIYSDRSWTSDHIHWLAYTAFIIPIFSAIRLAKFNNDTRQSDSFIGLPTPANSILICSLPLVMLHNSFGLSLSPIVLCLLSFVLSFLLVAELPLFALKFKHFNWKGNEIRFVFLGLSLALLIALQFIGIPLIIVLYIIMSVIHNFMTRSSATSH